MTASDMPRRPFSGLGETEKLSTFLNRRQQKADQNCDDPNIYYQYIRHYGVTPYL